MLQPGAGLVAAVAATDAPPSSSMAPAAGVSWGAALAVHPMYGLALGLGPSSNVTPLVGIFWGPAQGLWTPCEVLALGLRPSSLLDAN